MGTRGVYVVHYNGGGSDDMLTVMVDGTKVAMEKFTETHTVIHVTSLAPKTPSEPSNNLVALIVAEDAGDGAPVGAVWGG